MDPTACRSRIDAMLERERARRSARSANASRAERTTALCALDTPVPVLERGYQPVVDHGSRLHMPASGTIRFPAFDWDGMRLQADGHEKLVVDTSYLDSEIDGKLAQALELDVALAARDSAHTPLFVVADPDVSGARLARVHAAIPAGMQGYLVVAKAPSAILAEFLSKTPFAPEWVQKRIVELSAPGVATGMAGMIGDLSRAAGASSPEAETWPCPGVKAALYELGQSGSADQEVALANLADGLRACRCQGLDVEDIDALESLLVFLLEPFQNHALVPLPAAGQPVPIHPTVEELARALAR